MKIGKAHNLKTGRRCLNCQKVIDGASCLIDETGKDSKPKPGDFTVCAYCQYLMVFDTDLCYREPTFSELHEIANDPRVIAIKPILKNVF